MNRGLIYIVYCHTFPDGRRYVGITSKKPEKRWKRGLGYYPQTPMRQAIAKHGWGSISHEVLFSGLPWKHAKALEIKLIQEWGLTDPAKGLNTSPGNGLHQGGDNSKVITKAVSSVENRVRHVETRQKKAREARERLAALVRERLSSPEHIARKRAAILKAQTAPAQESMPAPAVPTKPPPPVITEALALRRRRISITGSPDKLTPLEKHRACRAKAKAAYDAKKTNRTL